MQTRRRYLALLTGVLTAFGVAIAPQLANVASAGTPPSGFTDSSVATIPYPTDIAETPDGRLLVTSQLGKLYVVQNGKASVALDISSNVCSFRERGMLGVAVDPSFASNGYIYMYYSLKKQSNCSTATAKDAVNRVVRWTMSGNTISTSSQKVLIDNIPTPFGFHNAGAVRVGPDHNLYISVGDGKCYYSSNNSQCGTANHAAQDLGDLNGKVLRIGLDGSIPSGNPFTGSNSVRCNTTGHAAGKQCQEVYAYGFRNPFRIAIDPNSSTPNIRVDDVGEATWEEINILHAGHNYGWPNREGFCTVGSTSNCVSGSDSVVSGYNNPIYTYGRNGGSGASITGGAFVPNSDSRWTAKYKSGYFFADYVQGFIKFRSSSGSISNFETNNGSSSIVDMAFLSDPTKGGQSLYYTTYGNNPSSGQLRVIRPTAAGNNAPSAAISATPTVHKAPVTVSFDASGSHDPDAGDKIASYKWNFGDGSSTTTTTSPTTTHSYSASGIETATVTVTDTHGATGTASVKVYTDRNPPNVTFTSPTTSQTFVVGKGFSPLSAKVTDSSTGATLPDSDLTWYVLLHHDDHTHPFMPPTQGNNLSLPAAPPPEGFEATPTSHLEIHLEVTENGVTSQFEQDMQPVRSNLTFATSPSGLKLDVFDDSVDNNFTASKTFVGWEGQTIQLKAPSSQTLNGTSYVFDHWSDGGSATHNATVGASDTTYTAVYKAGSSSGSTKYEAESSANTLAGGAKVSSCSACSGGSKVGYVGNNAGTLTFNNVNVSTSGTYAVTVAYCTGTARSAQISANGGSATTVNFPVTGGFTTPGNVTVNLALKAGSNTIKFANSTGYAPDFDAITVPSAGSGGTGGNDFSIAVSPTSLTITRGQTMSTSIVTKVTSGSAGTITISSAGGPTGSKVTHSSTITAGQNGTLTIATTSSTTAGTYHESVTGTEGGVTHSVTLTVTVK